MPELPDVEGFARVLKQAAGARIDRVLVRDAGVLRGLASDELTATLKRRAFASPRRHGKWLVAPLRTPGKRHRKADPSVVVHFGMTGALHWSHQGAETRHRHDRLIVETAKGELRYRDMRKLKGVQLASDDGKVAELLADTGPDAAEISRDELVRRLGERNRSLKTALLDQSVIAGLGNLLVDEVAWRARIHPSRRTSELTAADHGRIHRRMGTVLRHATRAGRVLDRAGWLTGRRNLDGGTCSRCGTALQRSWVASRRTVWCPRCQSR